MTEPAGSRFAGGLRKGFNEMDTTILYRIKDWIKNYENNRTRDLKKMEFVLVPNRMDGDGYTALVDHPNGAAHLGAWLALIQVASKCEPRGTLVRANGNPHTAETLSRITRIPAKIFEEVLPRLAGGEIGWMEEYGTIPHQSRTKPQEGADSCGAYAGAHAIERNGTEGNGTEHSAAGAATHAAADPPPIEPEVLPEQPSNWEQFQEAVDAAGMRYSEPDRQAMQRQWRTMPLAEQLAAVHHIRDSLTSGAFSDPQYTPAARNYLREKRWERGVRERAGPQTVSKNQKAFQIFMAQRDREAV